MVCGSGRFRRGCAGDDGAGTSVADGDGPVGFSESDEVVEMEVAMVRVAEEPEDFDVGESLVDEPFVEVVDGASVGWGIAAGVDAVAVVGDDGEPLDRRGVASGPSEFEDFAVHVLEAVVEVIAGMVEE